ncbi:hypothetical protein [Calothrix sp. NIES-2100]|uniref:hypothetical protein n=1 Tax=Calothrix sp. NIES-2100 TaxID=1954172 RepID=UPI000BBCDAF5
MVCPSTNHTTAANKIEREQVIPILDSIKVKTNKSGISGKRVEILAADKGYFSQARLHVLHQRGIRPHFSERIC